MALSEDAAHILADQVSYLVENYIVKKEIPEDKLSNEIKESFKKSNELISVGKNEEAISLILRCIKDQPNYVRGRLRLIYAYNEAGNPVMALANSQYALAQATTPRTKAQLLGLSGQAVFSMFKKYKDVSLLQPCEAFYTNAVKVYPSDPFARWNIVGVFKDAYGIDTAKIPGQLAGLCDQCLDDGYKYKTMYQRVLNDWSNILGDQYLDYKDRLEDASLSTSALSDDQSEASRLSRRALVAASLAAGTMLLYQGVADPELVQNALNFFTGGDVQNIEVAPSQDSALDNVREVELKYDLDDLRYAEVKYDLGDLS